MEWSIRYLNSFVFLVLSAVILQSFLSTHAFALTSDKKWTAEEVIKALEEEPRALDRASSLYKSFDVLDTVYTVHQYYEAIKNASHYYANDINVREALLKWLARSDELVTFTANKNIEEFENTQREAGLNEFYIEHNYSSSEKNFRDAENVALSGLKKKITDTFARGSGAEYVLYPQPGVQAENYGKILEQLKPGDLIAFSNGQRFIVRKILGHGTNNLILEIGEGRVLRIALQDIIPGLRTQTMGSLLEGHKILTKSKIPIVNVDTEKSLVPEYIIADKVDVIFTLDQLVDNEVVVSDAVRTEAFNKLLELGRIVAPYQRIGDLHNGQLAWTASGWVLLDWTHNTELATQVADRSPFFSLRLPKDIQRRMNLAIEEGRIAERNLPTRCSYHLIQLFRSKTPLFSKPIGFEVSDVH